MPNITPSMNMLGIKAFHGVASAAIVVDRELIAAVKKGSFNRIKHQAGFPAEAIRYYLDAANLTPIKSSKLPLVLKRSQM